MNVPEWNNELKEDIDKDFILNGMKNGFKNVDNCIYRKLLKLKIILLALHSHTGKMFRIY